MIYMIHLTSNIERGQWIRSLPLSPSPIIFPAIDTRTDTQYDHLLSKEAKDAIEYASRTGYKYNWSYMTRGAIGCYLSHVSLWSSIPAESSYRIIMEDDVRLLPAYSAHHMNLYVKYAPTNWDILLFSYKLRKKEERTGQTYQLTTSFFGLQFYAIRQHVIDKLVLFPIRKQIDTVLSESGLKIYAIYPPLATSNYDLPTTIQLPIHH